MKAIYKKDLDKAIEQKDFSKLYNMFESMYNPYPVQMGRYEAFGKALRDGFITQELYDEAQAYYGNLWHYVGD